MARKYVKSTKKQQRKFKNTAQRTAKKNINVKVPRGGIRL